MTSLNHISGGIAITGISLSFFDINIFSEPSYLAVCVFASLLPDIDHTKSIIGKMVFPLARYLDRNFGHRTITHSLTFFIPVLLIVIFTELNFLNPYFEKEGLTYSMIFGFAMFSHFILDMATIAGIPLFYPLMKNPCVFPANPNYRIRSGNVKSEALVMALFVMVIFSSVDLFQNGFWTSYNRGFGTIMHVNREFKRQSNLLEIAYIFDLNGIKRQGKAYLLNATDEELELFENGRIWTLSSKDNRVRNIDLKPTPTTYKYGIRSINFNFYTEDQLNDSLKLKVVSGEIQSNSQFLLGDKLIKNEVKFQKKVDLKIKALKIEDKKIEKESKIAILKAKLAAIRQENGKEVAQLQKLEKDFKTLQNALNNDLSIYDQNKIENDLIETNRKIALFNPTIKSTSEIETEIDQLIQEINTSEITYFSGTLNIYNLPRNHKFALN